MHFLLCPFVLPCGVICSITSKFLYQINKQLQKRDQSIQKYENSKYNKINFTRNMKFGYKFKRGELPGRIGDLITSNQNKVSLMKNHKYPTRNKKLPKKPKSSYNQYSKSFLCNWIDVFGNLPTEIKESKNINQFSKKCKNFLLS